MTIESSLESGCGLSYKSVQDGCNGTCVNLEASKPIWSGNIVRLGDHRLKETSTEKNLAVNRLTKSLVCMWNNGPSVRSLVRAIAWRQFHIRVCKKPRYANSLVSQPTSARREGSGELSIQLLSPAHWILHSNQRTVFSHVIRCRPNTRLTTKCEIDDDVDCHGGSVENCSLEAAKSTKNWRNGRY